MKNFETTITDWRDELNALEDSCPWPGPRPYIPKLDDGKRPFIGRDDEVFDLITQIRDNPLVIVHGDSAVGKSSFINMGLSRSIKRFRCSPIICTSWPHMPPPSSFGKSNSPDDDLWLMDQYVADLIRHNYPAETDNDQKRDRTTMPAALREDLTKRGAAVSLASWNIMPVLVFDQFEEYLRDTEEQGADNSATRLYRWIAYVNKVYSKKLRIVLSFRSEHYAKVRPLERMVNPHLFQVFELGPLTKDADIRRIIACEWGIPAISVKEPAAERLFTTWQVKKLSSSAIFELQAELYASYWEARGDLSQTPMKVTISEQTILELSGDEPKQGQPNDTQELTRAAFGKTFQAKLDHCMEAFNRATQDTSPNGARLPTDVFVTLAKDCIRKMVPHLSVESYKERRSLWQMLELSHPQDIDMLCDSLEGTDLQDDWSIHISLDKAKDIVGKLWDDNEHLLSLDSSEILKNVGLALRHPPEYEMFKEKGLFLDCVPWEEDPYDHSAGPVLGEQDGVAFVELVRSFLLAVLWLDASHICRVTDGNITLVHDQLGRALREWTSTLGDDPYADLLSLTSVVGERVHWDMRPLSARQASDHHGLLEAVISPYFVNARVQRSWIDRVIYRNLIFLNCDFRQTRFNECVFDNIQFVNCLMDGTLLDGCTVVGYPCHEALDCILDTEAKEIVYGGGVPEFWAEGASDVITSLSFFREKASTPTSVLYSLTSGMPAIVVQKEKVLKTDAGKIQDTHGGLSIIGGRVSNLMVRGSRFIGSQESGKGELAIAYTAGSSVDFVEQNELSLYILGSAIRGLSISRPLREVNTELSYDAICVTVRDSLLAGPWFSRGLRGYIEFSGSMIWGEANLSEKGENDEEGLFVIRGDVKTESDLANLSDSDRSTRNHLRGLLPEKTDYRSNAAEYELTRRLRRSREDS